MLLVAEVLETEVVVRLDSPSAAELELLFEFDELLALLLEVLVDEPLPVVFAAAMEAADAVDVDVDWVSCTSDGSARTRISFAVPSVARTDTFCVLLSRMEPVKTLSEASVTRSDSVSPAEFMVS